MDRVEGLLHKIRPHFEHVSPDYPAIEPARGDERIKLIDDVRGILAKPEGLVSPDLHSLNEAFLALLGLPAEKAYYGMGSRSSNPLYIKFIDEPNKMAEVHFSRSIEGTSTSLMLKQFGRHMIESVNQDPKKKNTARVNFNGVTSDGTTKAHSFILGREMSLKENTLVNTNEVRGIYERSLAAVEMPQKSVWQGLRRVLPGRK